jgi:hypothetical protein
LCALISSRLKFRYSKYFLDTCSLTNVISIQMKLAQNTHRLSNSKPVTHGCGGHKYLQILRLAYSFYYWLQEVFVEATKNTTSKMLLKRPNLRFNYRRLGKPAVPKTNCYILHIHSVRTDRKIGWTSMYIDTIYKHGRLTKLALYDSSQLGCCFKERRSVRDRRLQKCTYK